ncbi:YxeA family protein [Shouchella hunanensis]|uniref:YxeA family protein n=1 Tax=Shouchella hunanensis TaxID=766894 RepID=A0ABY7WA38_9BACI|nr:YxeA family protein [Shouchella hunanensis]WDF05568.1 YxeA family protein [Shouchella hunanensis]
MKKTISVCLVLVIAIASLYFFSRETFDRFNPLLTEEYVFVEVQGEPTDDDGRYKYDLEGVNEGGETKRVVFSASTRLDPGTFVRVLAKGRYSKQYELINESEMP